MTTDVRYDDRAERYELVVDGEVVAFADARHRDDGTTVMPHTVVDPARRGRGLGEVLVRAALDDLRRLERRVVPSCWFVADVIQRDPSYGDLVAP